MAFTISKSFKTYKQIPGIGITLPAEEEELEVLVSVVGVSEFLNGSATVIYTTSITSSDQSGSFLFTFEYTNADDIIKEAEAELKKYLTS